MLRLLFTLQDCTDLIEAYFEEKRKKEEYEELRRQEEADGHYEVSKVVDVRFHKVSNHGILQSTFR